jgi:hypothetical protein
MNENVKVRASLQELYDRVTKELEMIKSKKAKTPVDLEQIMLKSREQSRLFREQVKYNIDNHLTL